MAGRSRWGPAGPPAEAYSRVTNPERFRSLHTAMREIIVRLERDFEVERTEGYGFDEELEKGLKLAGPSVRLTPRDPDAAPIAAAFSTFPGVHVRFGRWRDDLFPSCGCDACDESAEEEIERLTGLVDDVIAGRFLETVRRPLIGDGWQEWESWSPDGRRSRGGSRVGRLRAREMAGGRRRLALDWKPWRRRRAAG